MIRGRRRLPPWGWVAILGLVLVVVGLVRGEMQTVRETSTYRNFDVEAPQSGVEYLTPGVPDAANEGEYTFDGPIHAAPLVALGIVFLVFFLLRNVRSLDMRLKIKRGLTQWLAFVVARLGMFRVAGVAPVTRCGAGIFPFLNCQACEMASGACPIGQFQMGLLQRSIPLLAFGTVILTAALLGRWICGWLCPFGLFSDIMDRISLKRFQPSHRWRLGGYVVLAFVLVGSVVLVAVGITTQGPFCSTVCASGKIYGLLPYYVTTGAGEVAAATDLSALVLHATLFGILIVAMILISGRVFCRYACPLGAALGLANKLAAVQVVHNEADCNACGRCLDKCPMGIDLSEPDFLTQSGCIRCGRCVAVCTPGARTWQYPWTRKLVEERSPRHERVPVPQV
jgi:ferredoxin